MISEYDDSQIVYDPYTFEVIMEFPHWLDAAGYVLTRFVDDGVQLGICSIRDFESLKEREQKYHDQ